MFGYVLAQAESTGGSSLLQFAPFLLIIGIFYFMMIRPQQRKERERKKMIEELVSGQRVMFGGGILGTIKEAREHTFLIEVADGVVIEVARGAVARVLKEGEIASVEEGK